MADTENYVPFSDLQTKIDKNVKTIKGASRGARARMPIHNAIEDIAKETDKNLQILDERLEKEKITETAESAKMFAQSIRTINTIMERYQQAEIEKESVQASAAADLKKIDANLNSDVRIPTIGFSKTNYRWQLHSPVWPMFGKFSINRGRDSSLRSNRFDAETVPEDGAALDYTNILGQIPNVNVQMVDRLWHSDVVAYAASYNQMAVPDNLVKYTYEKVKGDRPRIALYLPPGYEGTGEGSNENRPFLSHKVVHPSELPGLSYAFGDVYGGAWVGRPYDRTLSGTVGTEANPVYPPLGTSTNKDLDGVLITFQKTRMFENSASASGSKTFGNLYAPGTNIMVVKNNVHWDQRVTVFLPRGGRVTASIVDGEGNKFSREVAWGSYPHVLMQHKVFAYKKYDGEDVYNTEDHPELTCGGIVFSGGRANGFGTYLQWPIKRVYGFTNASGKFYSNNDPRWHGNGDYPHMWYFYSDSPATFGYSYNTVDVSNGMLNFEDAIMAEAIYRQSWALHFGAGSNYTAADAWVSRNVMIPISVVGVWFSLSSNAETAIRD